MNAAGGGSYLHVISGCSLATGTTWNLLGGCPGWSFTLENEDHTPAPAVLPAGWTGWLRFSAPGMPSGSTCCAVLTFQCGDQNAQIYVCATVCRWAMTAGVEDRHEDRLGFGIRSIAVLANVNDELFAAHLLSGDQVFQVHHGAHQA